MAQDRQARLFDLYDQARAAENLIVLVSDIATAELDVATETAKARRVLRHLDERKPDVYRID